MSQSPGHPPEWDAERGGEPMKSKHALGAILTSLAALCGATASADDGGPPPEGRRVRVTAPRFSGKPVTGDLIAAEAAKVTVRRAGSSEVVAIPRAEVTRFEIRTRESRKGRATLIGALVGLGVGAAVGYAAGDDCGDTDAPRLVCFPRPASGASVGVVGAGLGAVLGLILGPGEKWETADPARFKLTAGRSPGPGGGLHVELSLAF